MKNLNEHDKLNQELFDKWAGNFEETGVVFRYFQKRVISLINLKSPSNFLDMGCGTGWAVRYASKVLKSEGHFVGIDISEKMIEKAREIARGMNNVSFYQASAEELPLENDLIDNIICTFSFHHYLHPEKALAEAWRVLKPKGRIYILDGAPDDFFTNWIEKLLQRREKEHVKQYSTSEMKKLFYVSKLKYLKSKTMFYPIKLHIAEK